MQSAIDELPIKKRYKVINNSGVVNIPANTLFSLGTFTPDFINNKNVLVIIRIHTQRPIEVYIERMQNSHAKIMEIPSDNSWRSVTDFGVSFINTFGGIFPVNISVKSSSAFQINGATIDILVID